MAKKQKSFAEKAVKHSEKEMVHVKFVKSVASNKEGYWRFNESMIPMEKGESLETMRGSKLLGGVLFWNFEMLEYPITKIWMF